MGPPSYTRSVVDRNVVIRRVPVLHILMQLYTSDDNQCLFCVVILCFVLFYVLFVCKCVLYYCHRVATQLQLNISYHIKFYLPILLLCLCILIDKYALFCIFFASWHSPATLTTVLPCFFPQLQGKYQGIFRKDRARSALFLISELCCSVYCLCQLCSSVYCLCVNVYCTTATGCQPNCS